MSGKKNRPWEDDTHTQPERHENRNLQPQFVQRFIPHNQRPHSPQQQLQDQELSNIHYQHEYIRPLQHQNEKQRPVLVHSPSTNEVHVPSLSRGSFQPSTHVPFALSPRSKRRRLSDEESPRGSNQIESSRRASYALLPPPPLPPPGGPFPQHPSTYDRSALATHSLRPSIPSGPTAQPSTYAPPHPSPSLPPAIPFSPQVNSSWRNFPTPPSNPSSFLVPILNNSYPTPARSSPSESRWPGPPAPPPPPSLVLPSNPRSSQQVYSTSAPSTSHSSAPLPRFSEPTTSQSKTALEHQIFYLTQENEQLRNDAARLKTEKFAPGANLRGIVIKLFELAEDYSEIILLQNGDDNRRIAEAKDVNEEERRMAAEVGYKRKGPVTDDDLMCEEGVVAILRRMHNSLKARLNLMKMAKANTRKPHGVPPELLQSNHQRDTSISGSCDCTLVRSRWMEEKRGLLSKVNWLEGEATRLQEKFKQPTEERHCRTTVAKPSSHPKSDDDTNRVDDNGKHHSGVANMPNDLLQSSMIPFHNLPPEPSTKFSTSDIPEHPQHQQLASYQEHHPESTSSMSPSTPSTLAPSVTIPAPSPIVYNKTLTSLQHRLSLTELLLKTLQDEHARLLAALTRSQTRAAALEKKFSVSEEENNNLLNDRDRYQMLYETLEEQLADVTASRDEYRKQAVAGGGQYTSILAMATRMEMKGVEDRKKWKVEKEALEEQIKALTGAREQFEKERNGLADLLKKTEAEMDKVRGKLEPLSNSANQNSIETAETSSVTSIANRLTSEDSRLTSPPLPQQSQPPEISLNRVTTSPNPELQTLRTENTSLKSRIVGLEKTIEDLRDEGESFAREAGRFMKRMRAKDRSV